MQFVVSVDRRAADTVLSVEGELDIATVRQLREAVSGVLEQEPGRLLLDLSETRFIDSTGCRELVRTAKAGGSIGTVVELVVPADNWRVKRVVDFVGLEEIVTVHEELPAP